MSIYGDENIRRNAGFALSFDLLTLARSLRRMAPAAVILI